MQKQTTTTTTTTYAGTFSEISPASSTIVLKSTTSAEPVKYIYNDRTLWVDSAGNVVNMETLRNQPVTFYYQQQGDQLVLTKVMAKPPTVTIMQPVQPALPKVVEKKTTTTTEVVE